jgi:hypothetical protein
VIASGLGVLLIIGVCTGPDCAVRIPPAQTRMGDADEEVENSRVKLWLEIKKERKIDEPC